MTILSYSYRMFVSIVLDPGSTDSARGLAELLALNGFKKIQRSCWECTSIPEDRLAKLKKDIDRVTDYYDMIRMYQFPVDGNLAITELSKKKWRKLLVKAPAVVQETQRKTTVVHKTIINK